MLFKENKIDRIDFYQQVLNDNLEIKALEQVELQSSDDSFISKIILCIDRFLQTHPLYVKDAEHLIEALRLLHILEREEGALDNMKKNQTRINKQKALELNRELCAIRDVKRKNEKKKKINQIKG